MELSPEQCCDMLGTVFNNIPRVTLWNVLLKYHFQIEPAIEHLLELSKSEAASPLISGSPTDSSKKINEDIIRKDLYRGKKMNLPNSFLRVPGWEKKHEEAIRKKDFMSLFADPVFLREVEREFGDDYEQVLREHLKVEHQNWVAELGRQQPTTPLGGQSGLTAAAYSNAVTYGSGVRYKGEANSPNSPYSLEDSLNDVHRRMQSLIERFGETVGMFTDLKVEAEEEPLVIKGKETRICEEEAEDMPLLWRN